MLSLLQSSLNPYGYCVVKDCPEVTAQPWQDIVETFEVDSEGYYQRVLTVVDNLQKAKEYKLAEINNNYQTDKSQPVEIGGVFYKGGMESAQAIKSLVDLVTYMGGEECLIQPVDSEPLLLSLEDSLTVAATIGYAYQTVYIKKERLCRDILACESVEQVLGDKME